MSDYFNDSDLKQARGTFWKWFWWIVLVLVVIGIVGFVWSWLSMPSKILDPNAALARWQWFYDTKTGLDGLAGNIQVAQKQVDDFKATNGDPSKWTFVQQDAYQHDSTVLSGYMTEYNNLANQYNAKMDDITRNFAAPRDLPRHIPNWGQ